MTASDLRLDEATWSAGNMMRRAEWRSCIEDFLRHARLTGRYAGSYILLTPSSTAIALEFLDEEGGTRAEEGISLSTLEPHVKEYLAIIRRLDEGAGHREPSWVEAVDMAKKVVHDSAAKTLMGTLPALSTELETYRCLFTLILAVMVDTTALVHARGHGRRA